MPPILRTVPADFHYTTYDNGVAAPWSLGAAQVNRDGLCFYGLDQDLAGLVAWRAGQVPNLQLHRFAAGTFDGTARDTLVLQLGGSVANSPGVLFTGGIHAREWMAPAVAYYLAEYLVRNYAAAPVGPYQTALSNLINSRNIYIAPCVNPHGNAESVYGVGGDSRTWRPNRRVMPTTGAGWRALLTTTGNPNPPFQNLVEPAGLPPLATYDVPVYITNAAHTVSLVAGGIGVDLNRNCGSPSWGHVCIENGQPGDSGAPTNNGESDYFGPQAFSEIETQNLRNLVQTIEQLPGGFGTAIDYHSYKKAILYPTETSDRTGGRGANYTQLGLVLQKLIGPWNEPVFSYDYYLGSPMEILRYSAVGTLADYIGFGGASSFVVELDGTTFTGEPEDTIQNVFEKNLRGALGLLAAAGNASTTTTTRDWFARRIRTITSGESAYLAWNVFGRGTRLP